MTQYLKFSLTLVNRKPSHTGFYHSFHSNQSYSTKNGILKTLINQRQNPLNSEIKNLQGVQTSMKVKLKDQQRSVPTSLKLPPKTRIRQVLFDNPCILETYHTIELKQHEIIHREAQQYKRKVSTYIPSNNKTIIEPIEYIQNLWNGMQTILIGRK